MHTLALSCRQVKKHATFFFRGAADSARYSQAMVRASPGLWKQMRRKIPLLGSSDICRWEQEWWSRAWTRMCSPKGQWLLGLQAAFMHRGFASLYICTFLSITLDVNTPQPGKYTELHLTQCALQHPLSILQQHRQQRLSFPFLNFIPGFIFLGFFHSHSQNPKQKFCNNNNNKKPEAIQLI